MFNKETRHIAFGIVVLGILIALYAAGVALGFLNVARVCIAFVAAAFVLAMVVPRLSPVQTTKYDETTPVTSYVLGNRMTFLSYNYLFLQAIIAAVMIRIGYDRLAMAFYIQMAVLVVYLSLVGYMTARPGTAAEDGESQPDQIPAARPVPNADDSKPIASDRTKIWIDAVVGAGHGVSDAKLKSNVNKAVDALRKAPVNSYESMNEVDYQINAIVGELPYRIKEGKVDLAIECCQLICILVEQRTGLYNQIVAKRNK